MRSSLIVQRWFAHLVHRRWSPPAGCCTPCTPRRWRSPGLTKTLFALVFGVAVWGWVLGLTGAALRFLSNYSATRRYIADASYWIYLAHLPVVAAFQVWVGHWPLHWGVKYPFILVASFAVLFLSYHYLVRPTFIGQAAERPQVSAQAAAARLHARRPPPRRRADTGNGGPVAQLRGVTKKLRRRDRARRHRHRSAPRRIVGGARPERRRQVHGDLAVARAHRGGCGRRDAARRRAAGHRAAPRTRRDDAGRRAAQGAARCASSSRSPPATTPIR